jgi:hypothetical protein
MLTRLEFSIAQILEASSSLESSDNGESPPGARIQLTVDFYLPRQAKTRVMEHMLSS